MADERSIVRVLNDFQPEIILLEKDQDVQFAGYEVSGFGGRNGANSSKRGQKWDNKNVGCSY
ncbi:hypothetical protein [Citrobacter braakii]|uniref:hypothetical protein n=1 Tax=Citrobacter braakii TaxID=57706 RepID=UPI001F44C041|nr:hypothetical protein [Citrobacter braakii]